MICAACQAQLNAGKRLDNAVCAFPDGKPFSADNWNCSTANIIRDLLDDVLYNGVLHERVKVHEVVRDGGDQKHAIIDLYEVDCYEVGDLSWPEARCLWVSWYKRRGRTEAMWLLANEGDEAPRLPTEADLIVIAKVIEKDAQWAASPEGIEWRAKYGR